MSYVSYAFGPDGQPVSAPAAVPPSVAPVAATLPASASPPAYHQSAAPDAKTPPASHLPAASDAKSSPETSRKSAATSETVAAPPKSKSASGAASVEMVGAAIATELEKQAKIVADYVSQHIATQFGASNFMQFVRRACEHVEIVFKNFRGSEKHEIVIAAINILADSVGFNGPIASFVLQAVPAAINELIAATKNSPINSAAVNEGCGCF